MDDDALDPRIARSRRVVRRAALEELGSVGYGAFSIESVAKRSGVAKSTIYRHWSGKLALIADALETLNAQPTAEHDRSTTTTARERVEVLMRHLATAFVDSTLSACIPALIEAAEHDSDVRAFLHRYTTERRRTLTQTLADGVVNGEFPRDLDPELAALALSGSIVYCRVMTDRPFDPSRTPELVATVLDPRPAT